jgi:endo-1,4-beta-xylanase
VNAEGPWPKIDLQPGRAPGDYVRDAFRWAREADPTAQLFYNDYGAEPLNNKSDGIYRFLKQLKSEGVPIDGIGFQTHISYDQDLPEASLRANFKRFSDLGLVIHITEMDVALPDDKKNDADALQMQARQYEKFLRVCLETRGCQAFLTWGLTDKYSWIDARGLLLDKNYAPKPAYDAVARLLGAVR